MMNRAAFRATLRAPSKLFFRRYATETSESKADTPSTPSGPPLLLKIREDLKTALQEKDSPRLTVIRNIIDATNSRPVTRDIHILAILKRFTQDSKVASEHYKIAEREDLVKKQDVQTQILEEYAKLVEVMTEEEIEKHLKELIDNLKSKNQAIKFGFVMQQALNSPQLSSGKVARGDIVRVLQRLLPYRNQEKK